MGTDATRTLAVASMLLASRNEDNDGTFNGDPEYIKRFAYLNSKPDFKQLIEYDFIELLHDASNELDECDTEKSREEHRREEIVSNYSEEFEQFWKSYPKKTGKGGAYTAWKKQHPPLQTVLKSLEWQAKTEDWIKQNGQFIPMPATYLNQRRWEDGGSSDHSKPFDVNEFMKKANGL